MYPELPWYLWMDFTTRELWISRSSNPWLEHWHVQLCIFGSDS
jgi:hypothetical protein